MKEKKVDVTHLKKSITNLLIKEGEFKDYHAQVLADAVIEILKEEGIFADNKKDHLKNR